MVSCQTLQFGSLPLILLSMGGLLSFLLDFLPPHSAQSTVSDAEHQLCHGFLWTVWGENAMLIVVQGAWGKTCNFYAFCLVFCVYK